MIHPSHADSLRKTIHVLVALVIGLGIVAALAETATQRGISGYVPLHVLLEMGSIVVAMMIFAIGWNDHSRARPGNIALLAALFLGVALLDFSHTLSFKGMPDFVTPSDPEKAINFWLAARSMAALALLVVAVSPWRPFAAARTRYLILAATLAIVLLASGLFLYYPERMPRTFVAGQGLTAFKIYFEYGLIALNVAAAVALWRRMSNPLPFKAPGLFGVVCAMALSEFCFTLYADVYDVFNLLGHLYKSVSYYFLYRAIFVEAVAAPFQQLQLAKSHLLATQQAIPDLLWLKDADGVYLDCNPKFERFFGASKAQIVGKTDYDFVPRDLADFFREHDRKAMAAGKPSSNEEWIVYPDNGERCLLETIKTPIVDAAGNLIGVLGIARDITERSRFQDELQEMNRTLEQRVSQRTAALERTNVQLRDALAKFQLAQNELIQAEKMAALGSMVAGIAHELNTPIGNTLMTASTLKEHTAEFVRDYAKHGLRRRSFENYLEQASMASELIMNSLYRAAELIGSFKQVAVDQQSSLQREFRLRELVAEIVLTLGPSLRKAKVEVNADIPDGITLNSFPGALGQVLMNLINNAVVHAYADQAANSVVAIRAKPLAAGGVEIQVEDFGQGIPAQHLGRVFDPFFTTRFGKGGSGLGLSIVHNLVSQVLKGRISVDSNEGRGTCFVLVLPLQPSVVAH